MMVKNDVERYKLIDNDGKNANRMFDFVGRIVDEE